MFLGPFFKHAAIASLAVAALASPALAQGKRTPPALLAIPFESDRAAQRGDRAQISLNEDATRIPGHRIKSLPIVDGKMGEHVLLDGVELYFPFGRVISASTELVPGDAHYVRRVKMFDAVLGPTCAEEPKPASGAGPVEVRLNGELISVVSAAAPGESPTFKVVTVAERRWLDSDPVVQRLYASCLGRRTTVATTAPAVMAPIPDAEPKKAVVKTPASASSSPAKKSPAKSEQQ